MARVVDMNPRKIVRRATVLIGQVSLSDPTTGWRDEDEHTIVERYDTFLDGQFGMTCAADFSFLEETDADGLYLIDDGKQSLCALERCRAAYDKNKEPKGNNKQTHMANRGSGFTA